MGHKVCVGACHCVRSLQPGGTYACARAHTHMRSHTEASRAVPLSSISCGCEQQGTQPHTVRADEPFRRGRLLSVRIASLRAGRHADVIARPLSPFLFWDGPSGELTKVRQITNYLKVCDGATAEAAPRSQGGFDAEKMMLRVSSCLALFFVSFENQKYFKPNFNSYFTRFANLFHRISLKF